MSEAVSTVDATPASATGRQWIDLVLVAGIACAGFLFVAAPAALRVPIGVLAATFAPGYAMVAVLFPNDEHIDFLERLALALGMSFGFVAVLALVLAQVPGGFGVASIRSATTLSVLALIVLAVVRRARVPVARIWRASGARSASGARAVRFTQAIVVANLAVAALAFALTVGAASTPTELYALGEEQKLSDYQHMVAPGDPVTLHLGVHQASDTAARYDLVVRSGDRVLTTVPSLSLSANERWQGDVTAVLDTPGDEQELVIELKRPGDEQALRTLRLWVDVVDRSDDRWRR